MVSDEPIAIFVDAENLTQWVKNGQLSLFMKELETRGRADIRKAYARWSHPSMVSHQKALNQLGFELVHSFHPVSGKNSADMQMAVDVMQHAARDELRCIVLATGDSDFSPLFRRLREMGKDVIGIGPHSPLSEVVASSCSRFVYTGTHAKKPTGGKQKSGATLSLKSASALLKATLKASDGSADCSGLKSQMLGTNSAFDEKALGFKRFVDFVKEVPGVTLSQESTHWRASLSAAEATRTPNGKKSAPQPAAKGAACTPVERYSQILRSKKWKSPAPESFQRVVAMLGAPSPPPMPRAEIRTIAIRRCEGEVSEADVRKAVMLLHKSGLSQYAGKNEAGKSLWRVPPVSASEALRSADTAMLVRLLSGLKAEALPFETAHMTPLLLDRYDDEAFATLVAQAQDQVMNSQVSTD